MRTFVCTSFDGHWPVGTAAIANAKPAERAAEILTDRLKHVGLTQTVLPEQMEPWDTFAERVEILLDGDY